MDCRLLPKLVTFNDRKQHIGRYFVLFYQMWQFWGSYTKLVEVRPTLPATEI